ncbi:hypothetical protein ACQ3G7_05500 [Kosakonia oryzendophytica]|uniref:hypothetical protein n=1 Tax=Kosakonia TaxID=1330547 RepID=UPI0021D9C64B|nr:hypothetical protein [Kosakonia sp. ML.JS2a]UXY09821.1 hypothetical protein N7922_18435 [Kosakonia sp. ML.JS2a]
MKKKSPTSVNKVDFFDFRYELERAVLATTEEYSRQCLTRAKFLSYLLCRNLRHEYVELFNETFSSAEIAAHATTDRKEKTRDFRNNFSRLKQAIYHE